MCHEPSSVRWVVGNGNDLFMEPFLCFGWTEHRLKRQKNNNNTYIHSSVPNTFFLLIWIISQQLMMQSWTQESSSRNHTFTINHIINLSSKFYQLCNIGQFSFLILFCDLWNEDKNVYFLGFYYSKYCECISPVNTIVDTPNGVFSVFALLTTMTLAVIFPPTFLGFCLPSLIKLGSSFCYIKKERGKEKKSSLFM